MLIEHTKRGTVGKQSVINKILTYSVLSAFCLYMTAGCASGGLRGDGAASGNPNNPYFKSGNYVENAPQTETKIADERIQDIKNQDTLQVVGIVLGIVMSVATIGLIVLVCYAVQYL
jgi:hypothetical protein